MFSICIYDNYNRETLLVNHNTKEVSASTGVNGGFTDASFSFPAQKDKPINFWINKHIDIYDMYGDTVYEGTIESPRRRENTIEVSATGYFEKASRISAGRFYFSARYEGALVSISINAAGSGYVRGDIVTVSNGTGGNVRVDQVDDSGVVEDVIISTYGQGYSVSTGNSVSGGSGSGLTIDIDSVETGSSSKDIADFLTDLNPYWRDNFSMIDELDRVPIGPFVFTRKDMIDGALEDASKYGYLDHDNYDTPKRRELFFVVYEDRVLQMKRNPDIKIDKPDWKISIHNIKGNDPLDIKVDGSGIGNEIWVEFNDPDGDGNSFTLGTRNRNSIEKYGQRQYVESIGEASVEVAEIVEELLSQYKTEPTYSSTVKLMGTVLNTGGEPTPIWKVRAGDLVRITDFDAGLENLSAERSAALTFVKQTKYDHDKRTMSITLGTGSRLDLMLKRLGG